MRCRPICWTDPWPSSNLPVPLTVGLPPPEDRGFADVWSALGGELKPSIDVVVSAPINTGQRMELGPPVTEPPLFHFGGSGGLGGPEDLGLGFALAPPGPGDTPTGGGGRQAEAGRQEGGSVRGCRRRSGRRP